MCGDIGLPGDEDVEAEVAATIGGTLDNWRLEELDERWSINDEDMDSDSTALESRIRWKRVNAAEVLLVEASIPAALDGVRRSFLVSNILRKSEIFSSSS